MTTLSLSDLAEITGSELQGDADLRLKGIAPLDVAKPGDLSFVSSKKYLAAVDESKASAIILAPDLADQYSGDKLLHPSPYLAFAKAVTAFNPIAEFEAMVHPSAVIDASVSLPESVYIGANVVIEAGVTLAENVVIESGCVVAKDCAIGEASHLKANVTLYPDTQIGKNCRIHSGAVLGSDGFGYAPEDGAWFKINQLGNVVIGDEVEIGANTTIDCGALGSTTIETGAKLDNLIHIAHNVKIGENTAIAASVGIAGSTTIGKRCQIGGMAAINGHIEIVDDVIITGNSMVTNHIKEAGVYSSGMPAKDNRTWRKNMVRLSQLEQMSKKIRELEKLIKNIS